MGDRNLRSPHRAEIKAELVDQARDCVEEGTARGFTVAQLKQAASGDVERCRMAARNSFGDHEVDRQSGEDE